MASTAAAAAAAAAAGDINDGPVMSFMNKRLRALRKKYNRIIQTEEAVAQGKPLNKEQEELLRSKPSVSLLIDEYDKLRLPLAAAVADEISAASSAAAVAAAEPGRPSSSDSAGAGDGDGAGIEDLLRLLYFGSLFDVKPQSEFASTMLTRTHERECCLTYDYVTDEATDLLGERDLDSISALGGLLTSRPLFSTLSHKDALQSCTEHARRWLSNSDEPVLPGSDVTYAGLRARLSKILSSDYFTTTPEMKATEYVAAAAGKYSVGQTAVADHGASQSSVPEGEGDEYYHQKEEEVTDFQVTESLVDQSTVEGSSTVDQPETLYSEEFDHDAQEDQYKLQADTSELNENEGAGTKGYAPRRGYYNQRGGGRGNGSGRRGYPNGRGGRGGRAGSGGGNYQNGRNSSHDYYQRGYYNQKSRGGRSGGMGMYGNQGGANYGGHHVPSAEVMENRS